jgi:hypothetical protein
MDQILTSAVILENMIHLILAAYLNEKNISTDSQIFIFSLRITFFIALQLLKQSFAASL